MGEGGERWRYVGVNLGFVLAFATRDTHERRNAYFLG